MFFNNYYDTDHVFGYHPRSHARHYHDGSIDRYLRMKEQEEREAAFARRRHRELQERRIYEQRRRQEALAAREEELRRWKRHQQEMQWRQEEDDEDEDSDYEVDIVRGKDGHLYYVKKPIYTQPKSKSKPKSQPTITEEIDRPRQPIHQDFVVEEAETDDESSSEDSDAPANHGADDRIGHGPDLSSLEMHQPIAAPSRTHSHRKRRVTVIVEDASDSECEDEFDSPWRNRRPSPGQWMEPVEPYYG